jgi:hypothetical protein
MFSPSLMRAIVVSTLTLSLFSARLGDTRVSTTTAKAPAWIPAEYADGAKIERSEQIFRVSWGIGKNRGDARSEPIK